MAGVVNLNARLCVAVAVFRTEDDCVLVGHHTRTGTWGFPGGMVDPGEHPTDAARRELYEETGINCFMPRAKRPMWIAMSDWPEGPHTCLVYTVRLFDPKPREVEPQMTQWRWVPFERGQMPDPIIADLEAVFELRREFVDLS